MNFIYPNKKHNDLLRTATRLVKIAEFINLDGFQPVAGIRYE